MRRGGQEGRLDGLFGIHRIGEARRLYQMPALADDRLSDPKRRLFAVACLRRFEPALLDPRSHRALVVAERLALGLATDVERRDAEDAAAAAHYEMRQSRFGEPGLLPWSWADEQLTRAAVLVVSHGLYYAEDVADYARRAVAGTAGEADREEEAQCALLREVVGPWPDLPRVEPLWLLANDGAARRLAEEADAVKAFDLLPILADALEDAGCAEEEVLRHLRGPNAHVAGCWCLDALIGRA